jgi:hypothetical protein
VSRRRRLRTGKLRPEDCHSARARPFPHLEPSPDGRADAGRRARDGVVEILGRIAKSDSSGGYDIHSDVAGLEAISGLSIEPDVDAANASEPIQRPQQLLVDGGAQRSVHLHSLGMNSRDHARFIGHA